MLTNGATFTVRSTLFAKKVLFLEQDALRHPFYNKNVEGIAKAEGKVARFLRHYGQEESDLEGLVPPKSP